MPPRKSSLEEMRPRVLQRSQPSMPGTSDSSAPPTMDLHTSPSGLEEQTIVPSLDYVPRSIRCRGTWDSINVEGTSTSTHHRGPVTSRKTQNEVNKNGKKIRIEWSDEVKGPSDQTIQGQLARDIGSAVRDRVATIAGTYRALPEEERSNVYDYISTFYECENPKFSDYVHEQAKYRYKDWISECKSFFNYCSSRHPTEVSRYPAEFVHRRDQWDFLLRHWSSASQQALCNQMVAVRSSENKVNHNSGPTPIVYRAKKLKKAGKKAPLVSAWMEAYSKNKPGLSDKIQPLLDELFADFASNSNPNNLESESEPQPTLSTLPLETQLNVIRGEVGERKGTTNRGVGRAIRKDPKMRGGARNASTSTEATSSGVGEIRSVVSNLEAKVQQQEAAREAEREAFAREREASAREIAEMRRLLDSREAEREANAREMAEMRRLAESREAEMRRWVESVLKTNK